MFCLAIPALYQVPLPESCRETHSSELISARALEHPPHSVPDFLLGNKVRFSPHFTLPFQGRLAQCSASFPTFTCLTATCFLLHYSFRYGSGPKIANPHYSQLLSKEPTSFGLQGKKGSQLYIYMLYIHNIYSWQREHFHSVCVLSLSYFSPSLSPALSGSVKLLLSFSL